MDLNLLMSQRWALIQQIPSQLKNNGSLSTTWTNVQLAQRLMAIVGCGALDTTLDFKIEAAKDALGTSSKTVKSITQLTSANAALSDATTAATGAVSTSGGNLPAGAYLAKYTWFNSVGETLPSTESATITTTGTSGQNSITLTLPSIPAGATGANIYITQPGGSANTETFVGQMLSGTTFVVTSVPGTSLTANFPASPPPTEMVMPVVPPWINTTGDIKHHSVINCRTPELGDGFNYARITATVGNGATGANLHAELYASDIRFDPVENFNFAVKEIIR